MKELNIQYMAALVLRARQNDSDAFAELYTITYNKVYNYARHYLKDDFLAQDALQEIYILALKNLEKLNDPTLFAAWLNRISFNVCYDISAKNKLYPPPVNFDPEILDTVADDHQDINPESSLQQKEEHRRLKEALEYLPFHEKQVIILRFYNNMKLEEIAETCGISRSSVKRYLASGTNTLRQKMKG